MRINACTVLGNQIKMVWHCRECRKVECEWVDTDTAQYREWIRPLTGLAQTKQARKIMLDMASMVIYIDPIPDAQLPEAEETQESVLFVVIM